jgi:hypothetical protein
MLRPFGFASQFEERSQRSSSSPLAPARAPSEASALAVRALWTHYTEWRNTAIGTQDGLRAPQWSKAEQSRWAIPDLASAYLPPRVVADVQSVTPVDATSDSAYRIVTRYWVASDSPQDSTVAPVLTTTVYARRERWRWVLTSALPIATRTWARETRGSIDYYVAESVDQAMEITGAIGPEQYGPNGGFARPPNIQVFSGNPALGEKYRHELTQVVTAPVYRDATTTFLASEGIATWFGGTWGRGYAQSVRHLDSLLLPRPQLTLLSIIVGTNHSAEIVNASGAVLCEMLNEVGDEAWQS